LLFLATAARFLLLGGDRRDAALIFDLIAYSALAYALYSSVMFIVEPSFLLGYPKEAYLENLTGTFVNRNTAAAYFGSATMIWLILLLRKFRGVRKLDRLAQFLAFGRVRSVAMRAFGFVACLTATAATGSRAGFFITLGVGAFIGVLYGRARLKFQFQRRVLAMGVALAATLLIASMVGAVDNRMRLLGFDSEGRVDVYRASVALALRRPWLGVGLGNFETAFPAVRPDAVSSGGVWDRAHSTPLELGVDGGLPLLAAVGAVWLAWLGRLFAEALTSASAYCVAGLGVALVGTLHSCIDFSLQIPGYAVVFAAVASTATARAFAAREQEKAPLADDGGAAPAERQRETARV
jgi:O-antigen ligase